MDTRWSGISSRMGDWRAMRGRAIGCARGGRDLIDSYLTQHFLLQLFPLECVANGCNRWPPRGKVDRHLADFPPYPWSSIGRRRLLGLLPAIIFGVASSNSLPDTLLAP